MKIKCAKCHEHFEPKEQATLINESIANGLPLIMVDCTFCYHHFPYHLKNHQSEQINILCPIRGCYGSVTDNIGEKGIFGCGECGNVWHTKTDLDKDIDSIINHFSYRKACYQLVNDSYESTNIDISIYESNIIKELRI